MQANQENISDQLPSTFLSCIDDDSQTTDDIQICYSIATINSQNIKNLHQPATKQIFSGQKSKKNVTAPSTAKHTFLKQELPNNVKMRSGLNVLKNNTKNQDFDTFLNDQIMPKIYQNDLFIQYTEMNLHDTEDHINALKNIMRERCIKHPQETWHIICNMELEKYCTFLNQNIQTIKNTDEILLIPGNHEKFNKIQKFNIYGAILDLLTIIFKPFIIIYKRIAVNKQKHDLSEINKDEKRTI